MSGRAWYLSVCAAFATAAACPIAAAEPSPDEAAIGAIIDEWNRAHKLGPEGVDLIVKTLSDSAFVTVIGTKPTATVLNKAVFPERFKQMIREHPPKSTEHKLQRVIVAGTLAVEVGTLLREMPDGTRQSHPQVNVFAKEKAGWRMVCSVPAHALGDLLHPGRAQDQPAPNPTALKEARAAAEEFAARSNRAMAAPKGTGKLEADDLCDGAFAAVMPSWPCATVLDKAGMQKSRNDWLAQRPFRDGRETVRNVVAVSDTVALALSQWDEAPPAGTACRQFLVHGLARQADGWKRVFLVPGGLLQRAMPESAEAAAVRKTAEEFVGLFRLSDPTPPSRLGELLGEGFMQVGTDGQTYRGKEANIGLYTKGVAGLRGAFSQFHVWYDIDMIDVMGEAAKVYGRIQMSGRTKADDPFRRTVLETLILRKVGGAWRLVHEHSSLPQVPPAAGAGGAGT